MATPFIAGSAALLLSVKGKTEAVAKSALTRFQSTALPISSSNTDGDPLQTASQQGAGLVQVFDAIFGTTTLSRAELTLNDTAHFAGPCVVFLAASPPIDRSACRQKFTVTNHGKTPRTYTLSHVPAGTVATVDPVRFYFPPLKGLTPCAEQHLRGQWPCILVVWLRHRHFQHPQVHSQPWPVPRRRRHHHAAECRPGHLSGILWFYLCHRQQRIRTRNLPGRRRVTQGQGSDRQYQPLLRHPTACCSRFGR